MINKLSTKVVTKEQPAVAKPLFENESDFGAVFSECRRYRYALWRIWDSTKPLVMFVGLNPSSANEADADPTIRSVARIAKHNGYGGFYMMNCFPYVSTNPDELRDFGNIATNNHWLCKVAAVCKCVVFAWGSFAVVRKLGKDVEMTEMFPKAKALFVNKNGSPKHPLYCKSATKFVEWKRM